MPPRKQTGLRQPRSASKWEADQYYFDEEEAQLWTEVFPLFFKHIDGDMFDQPFELMDFWLWIFLRFFCWKSKSSGRRRYRNGLIIIPRKNAKTTTLGAVGLALPMICPLRRGQIFIIASDEEQGKIMFNIQVAMIQQSEDLQGIFYAGADYIEHIESGTKIRCLTSSQTGKTGLKPDMVIIDEYQEQKDTRMEMLMKTGAIANKEPVLIKIGTMGVDDETVKRPYQVAMEFGRKVIADPSLAPTFLPIIFESSQDDDPSDPALWRSVNPGFGISVDEVSFKALHDEAKEDPEKFRDFCQYNLNMPVLATSEFIDLKEFDKLKKDYEFDFFADKPVWSGLDIGDTDDMTAFFMWLAEWREEEVLDDDTGEESVIMVPHLYQKVWYYSPLSAIKKSEKKKFKYTEHVESGLIKQCGVHSINYSQLQKDIKEKRQYVQDQGMGFDPYRAGDVTKFLQRNRLNCVLINQAYKVLDFATRRYRDLVNEGDISHDGNPVFRWNLQNARILENTHKNIMLSKKHSAGKIDGIAAGITGLRLFLDSEPPRASQEAFTFG